MYRHGKPPSELKKFLAGEATILITTNVLAIGVDTRGVSIVINYDIPLEITDPDSEDLPRILVDATKYLQRVGRTILNEGDGVSISFVHDISIGHALDKMASRSGIELQRLHPEDWIGAAKTIRSVLQASQVQRLTDTALD